MSRRRAALALLVLVALWPVVTLVLHAGWSVDPWRLMSFGMYAVPARRLDDLRLSLSVKRDGAWQPLAQAAVAAEAERFIHARGTLGALASPSKLLGAMRAVAKADEARIELQLYRLDAKSARVVVDREVIEAAR